MQPPRDDQPSSPEPEPEPAGFAEPDQGIAPSSDTGLDETASPQSLRALTRLFEDRGELLLASTIKLKMRPVKFEDGCFEYQAKGHLEPNVTEKIARLLYDWTGLKWIIAESEGEAGHTLEEQDAMKLQAEIDEISTNPLVAEVLAQFPGAKVEVIEDITAPELTSSDDDQDDDGLSQSALK